jgi:hypothetical protein
MHMRGEPDTMQQFTDYVDVVAEVRDQLRAKVARAGAVCSLRKAPQYSLAVSKRRPAK